MLETDSVIQAGNLGGAMASNFYRKADAPHYYLGHGLELGLVVLGIAAVLTLRIGYNRANKKREAEGTRGLSEQELSDLGDKSPSFRYAI